MLTTNGKALMKINNNVLRANTVLKNTSGNDITFQNTGSQVQYFNNIFTDAAVYVGTSSATPSVSDYLFENDNSGLTIISTTGTNDSSTASYTQNYIGVFSRSFRNDTNSDIVINEIGLVSHTFMSNTHYYVLLAREVIDPVTIAPGEAYTFTMYIG